MSDAGTEPPRPAGRFGVAFLLAQLGGHAAVRYGERISELGLTRPQSGLLLAIARGPGRSQQALAAELGTPPSRLVALLDGLDRQGAIERRRNPADRRHHAVHLTDAGRDLMRRLAAVSAAHEAELTANLDDAEHEQLRVLLARLAGQQGLTPGVHPGYRSLTPADTAPAPAGQRESAGP
jgi:DNA-binding MarR family transcriptional regulator